MMRRAPFICFILCLICLNTYGQETDTLSEDTLSENRSPEKKQKQDTPPPAPDNSGTLFSKGENWPVPKKAGVYSAILPGLGQAYNERYWKIPIIYAGGALLGYAIHFNNQKYREFQKAYRLRQNNSQTDQYTNIYTDENLRLLRNLYRRDRDFYIILSVVFYGCNIMDAIVDAHLMEFDISEELSLNWQPGLYRAFSPHGNRRFPGVSVNINFKQ